MSLLKSTSFYKPFEYPWAYDAWSLQQKIHWLPEEVPLTDDVNDWNQVLTEQEKNLLTHIFRFFTQADIEVNNCYTQHYLNIFKPTEVRMMLTSFANTETIHIAAYSYLLDTIGMPETEYQAFMEYEAMKTKYEYMLEFEVARKDDLKHVARTMAVFGAFTEGLQLFASFAILMNFPRFNKMKGMGQIITWSVRDETLHSDSVIKLFKTFCKENNLLDSDFKDELERDCGIIIELEDKFIDLAFSLGDVNGLSANEMKEYIRYIANMKLRQLGLKPIYKVHVNPLPWMDEVINAIEHVNFFENKPTEYSKASTSGDWSDIFGGSK